MDINVIMKNPAKIRDKSARCFMVALAIYTVCKIVTIEARLYKIEKGLKELKPDEEA